MAIAVPGVGAVLRALTETGAAEAVGLGAHQRIDERGQQTAQQVGAGVGEAVGQELVQVDIVGTGHRVVLHRVTLVGLSKSHAMAAFLGYDTPVRSESGPYTTLVDATADWLTRAALSPGLLRGNAERATDSTVTNRQLLLLAKSPSAHRNLVQSNRVGDIISSDLRANRVRMAFRIQILIVCEARRTKVALVEVRLGCRFDPAHNMRLAIAPIRATSSFRIYTQDGPSYRPHTGQACCGC
ncbi:hypothetical protein R1CP_36065 (plasmid) [Rhodococcus opacus]|uniref:Uncharacterized protein n=1 Tax=Rhodococcus opacus TaxID=37919 RepID=A0A1B1KGV4_RHOOP|nr:hypothetical protein R1CP_36065 [Rhodococcus opacus]